MMNHIYQRPVTLVRNEVILIYTLLNKQSNSCISIAPPNTHNSFTSASPADIATSFTTVTTIVH